MVDAARSSVSGRGLAALGRVARTPPMLAASKAAWTREADGPAGRPPGRQDRPGAAQTRQTASRAREIVASTISAMLPPREVTSRDHRHHGDAVLVDHLAAAAKRPAT